MHMKCPAQRTSPLMCVCGGDMHVTCPAQCELYVPLWRGDGVKTRRLCTGLWHTDLPVQVEDTFQEEADEELFLFFSFKIVKEYIWLGSKEKKNKAKNLTDLKSYRGQAALKLFILALLRRLDAGLPLRGERVPTQQKTHAGMQNTTWEGAVSTVTNPQVSMNTHRNGKFSLYRR